jgi:proteasome lid subunit RPN8/RPN11
MIELPRHVADAIRAHVEETYPDEGCGCILTDAQGHQHTRPCANVQNELHARDPVNYPRDARTAYFIDPLELLAVTREADASGGTIFAWYHSHPEHAAYFSDEDKARAVIEDWGEPLHPDTVYLVYSVLNGVTADVKAFIWDDTTRDFIETPVTEEPA